MAKKAIISKQKSKPRKKNTKKPSQRFLESMKKQLVKKRKDLLKSVKDLEETFCAPMPSVIGEGEENTFEKEFTLSLIESHEQEINLINKALQKILEGTFGICIDCDCFIEKARLKILPATERCLECRKIYEKSSL